MSLKIESSIQPEFLSVYNNETTEGVEDVGWIFMCNHRVNRTNNGVDLVLLF